MNRNSMEIWWPALVANPVLDGWLPRTAVVRLPRQYDPEELMHACIQHDLACVAEGGARWDEIRHTPVLQFVAHQVRHAIPRLGSGMPVFLRSDFGSGKHSYTQTCYLAADDLPTVGQHIFNLVEDQATKVWMEPDASVGSFYVRELLDVEAPFVAFGGLPIAREFRLFVRDGVVKCSHFYWQDEENILNGLGWSEPAPPEGEWRGALRRMGALYAEDRALLEMAATAACATLPGDWSVDFLWARRREDAGARWWLIDMATAEDSWHPEHEEAGS